nr:hypothetical protein [uncultured Acetobacteroides sp.]
MASLVSARFSLAFKVYFMYLLHGRPPIGAVGQGMGGSEVLGKGDGGSCKGAPAKAVAEPAYSFRFCYISGVMANFNSGTAWIEQRSSKS